MKKKSSVRNKKRFGFSIRSIGVSALKILTVAMAPGVTLFIYLHGNATSREHTVEQKQSDTQILAEPRAGLNVLEKYMNPTNENELDSIHLWRTALDDFERASKQKGAPIRWKAATDFARGQIAKRERKLEAAGASFRQSVKKDPSWAAGHLAMASILSVTGKLDAALSEVREAERLAPGALMPVLSLARILTSHEQLESAIIEYRRALRMSDDRPFILAELALVYHAMAQFDPEALKYAAEALRKDPEIVSARIILAERALERDNGNEALEQMRTALLQEPDNDIVRMLYAESLAAVGDKDSQAMREYKRALAAEPSGELIGLSPVRLTMIKSAVEKGVLPPTRAEVATTGSFSATRTRYSSKRSKKGKIKLETMRTRKPRRRIDDADMFL